MQQLSVAGAPTWTSELKKLDIPSPSEHVRSPTVEELLMATIGPVAVDTGPPAEQLLVLDDGVIVPEHAARS